MGAIVCESSNAAEMIDLFPRPLPCPNAWCQFWRSPESFAAHVATLRQEKAWLQSGWTGESSFTGTESMAEALDHAFTGWPEGAAKVEALREKIVIARPKLPAVKKHDVAGALPDVPRMLAGNPMHMKRMSVSPTRKRPVITLMSDMSVNSGCAHANITRRAATVAAVVDLIEEGGYSCHVVAVESGRSGGFGTFVGITCKEAHEPADVGRLAFGLGHASMFRRLVFATIGGHKEAQPIGTGLGSEFNWALGEDLNRSGVYLIKEPKAHDFRDDAYAIGEGVKDVIRSLVDQGCPAFEAEES